MTNLTHIANLLTPLQNAISLQSWEDAEDLAGEISRLCRLKRLQEVQAIQEALGEKAGDCLIGAPLGNKAAPSPRVVPNSPVPTPPVTLETRFDENGHPDSWRNELAKELNVILGRACWLLMYHDDLNHARVVKSITARVAQFEEIQVI